MRPPVNFTSQDYLRNPAAGLERLRAFGPVVEIRFPFIGKVWITTTQELAGGVLKDSETFTLRKNGGALAGLRWWMPGIVRALANNMLTMDEPDHTRLRSIVDEAFRRRAVLDMEPRIFAIANELASEMFAEGIPADLVDRYARRVPLSVICELLGLPRADRPKFMAWTGSITRLTGLVGFLGLIPAMAAMRRYLDERLKAAREQGSEGLIAELVRVEKEGGRITPAEMVSMVFLLLGAGTETTTHLISGSVYELLVRKDVELGGVRMKKGEKIMATLAAANIPNGSISSDGLTAISPSARASIFALAISWRESRASVPLKLYSRAGQDSSLR